MMNNVERTMYTQEGREQRLRAGLERHAAQTGEEDKAGGPPPEHSVMAQQLLQAGLVKEQQPGPAYKLVLETDTHRFYKAGSQPEPASEMDQALAAAGRAQQALADAVEALDRRLVRVLRPEQTAGRAPNSCPMMAPLPMEIMAGSACTLDAVDRLTSILDRLVL